MSIRIVAIVALVALNGIFVAAEFALVRSRRQRLEAMVRSGDGLARLALRAVGDLPRMLSASQLGITLASLGLGWVTASTVAIATAGGAAAGGAPSPTRYATAAVIALVIVAFVHMVLGELVPRMIALAHAERLARVLTPPVIAFAWIATPFIYLVRRASQVVLGGLGQQPVAREEVVHSPDELRLLVEQSHESGTLEPQDAVLIEGVFQFSEKTAREVMTPRTAIVALPIDATLEEALAVVEEGGFSRYPVYGETIDDIIGLVLSKDLLPVLHRAARGDGEGGEFALRSVSRAVHVIPGSRKVEDVLADFKRRKEHLAVVLDEYGGTAGLVTMEDLLEEIVGEILDEHDEQPSVQLADVSGEVLVAGDTHIGELNERYGLSVPEDASTTIGGFVFGALGRLPRAGDRVTAGGAVLTVKTMAGRRIETIGVDLHAAGDRRGEGR